MNHLLSIEAARRSVNEIKRNKRNARTHNRKQRRKIAASIKKFGFCNPILIDEDGTIIAGHGRFLAAKDLGLTEVPVIVLDHLSDAEKRAYVIADNRIAQDAGWDNELLAIELEELSAALPDLGLDLEITGLETAELDFIMESLDADKPDPADDVDLKPAKQITTKAGDIWLLGKHRICCGDARSSEILAMLLGG